MKVDINSCNKLASRYEELSLLISSPKITSNQDKFREISIELSDLESKIGPTRSYIKTYEEIEEAKSLAESETDADMKGFYLDTITSNSALLSKLADELTILLKEVDKDDIRNCIVEIRAGTGGEEAALFALDIYRMYLKYAESKGFSIEALSRNSSSNGGIKETICLIQGKNAYGTFKTESGVHRVQRVPSTESAGRIHTSAVSVVVLPEIEEKEVEIKDEELRIDVYRSSGPGGQSVNTTDSAVRITHVPTGLTVACQDEKSQHKNKAKAMKILKSRLYDIEKQKQADSLDDKRKESIKGGDRSAKIKTYNYPQSRVTDHRINKSWFNLTDILNGDLDLVLTTTNEQLSS